MHLRHIRDAKRWLQVLFGMAGLNHKFSLPCFVFCSVFLCLVSFGLCFISFFSYFFFFALFCSVWFCSVSSFYVTFLHFGASLTFKHVKQAAQQISDFSRATTVNAIHYSWLPSGAIHLLNKGHESFQGRQFE